MRISIDIGGTFTDLVALDAKGEITVRKALTTPRDQTIGIEKCIQSAKVNITEMEIFLHGTTVAINTVIERKGAKAALITTLGFRDVYEIGRGNRINAYDLFFHRPIPVIPRRLRYEVEERIDSQGNVLTALSIESVDAVIEKLKSEMVDSVAICFLHAYRNDLHERLVKERIEASLPGIFVTASHEVLREYREYERTSTTALNAYVGPVVRNYLGTLETMLERQGFGGNFLVMQSNGGVMAADAAKRMPVVMMESGPVAGVIGAAKIGQRIGYSNVISFDMGGTTAKTSLVEGGIPEVVSGYYIGGEASGQPSMVPVVDIVEVGAGGGSIAWIDEAGGLRVGPASAGADPGPVCFNNGGEEPTVTDANLVLGRIDEKFFMRGELNLARQKALEVLNQKIAVPLGLDVMEAALGILQIADANMSFAVRAVSVEKGKDPRDFVLVASGGGGPLHSLAIARELNIPRVIIPTFASNFSALGMLLADFRHDYTQTYVSSLESVDRSEIFNFFQTMEKSGRETLQMEGAGAANLEFYWSVDMRYTGQEYTLSILVPRHQWQSEDLERIRSNFHATHLQEFGHNAPNEPLDVVRLHVAAIGYIGWNGPVGQPLPTASLVTPINTRRVFSRSLKQFEQIPVFLRSDLPVGGVIDGPAIVEDLGCTTVLEGNERLMVREPGDLEILIDYKEINPNA